MELGSRSEGPRGERRRPRGSRGSAPGGSRRRGRGDVGFSSANAIASAAGVMPTSSARPASSRAAPRRPPSAASRPRRPCGPPAPAAYLPLRIRRPARRRRRPWRRRPQRGVIAGARPIARDQAVGQLRGARRRDAQLAGDAPGLGDAVCRPVDDAPRPHPAAGDAARRPRRPRRPSAARPAAGRSR